MITRRRLLAGGAALALVAACGGDDDAGNDDDSDGAGDDASGDSPSRPVFPVTLQTTHGTVEIAAAPERIVSLGTPDAAIAAGTVPVAIPRSAVDPSGIHPYLQDTYDGAEVELLDLANGIPFAAVEALEPDLILATDIPVTPADYERLSQIAPVVTYRSPDHHVDNAWQDQTRLVGEALGLPDKADAMVRELDNHITALQTEYRRWNDLSFTFSTFADGTFFPIRDPDDGGFELLELLGFVIAPTLAATELGADNSLPPDQVPALDADLVVVLCPDEAVDALMAQSAFAALPAVADDRYFTVPPVIEAPLRVPGILNVQWLLDDVIDDIVTADPRYSN